MPSFSPTTKKNLLTAVALLAVFVAGAILGRVTYNDPESDAVTEVREKGYAFISPLLDYQPIEETKQSQVQDLKAKLEDYIQSQEDQGNIVHTSVYMRSLNNGPWIGINEKEDFSPASLLKVPILIAILKKAESNPGLLEQKITNVPIDDGTVQDIVPSQPLEQGKQYTVWELIEHMILYSDNQAKNLLLITFKDKDFDRVYEDLGISVPSVKKPEDFMSVRDYASFFRILYNASYLNKTMSNRALELLSRVDYKDGLVAGVPPGTVVSHKFGERALGDTRQLHDCGIIYYPNNPTILCIMTRGYDWGALTNVVRSITQITDGTVRHVPGK